MNSALRVLDRLSAQVSRRRQARRANPADRRLRIFLAGAAGLAAVSIATGVALIAGHGPSQAEQLQAYISAHAQKLDVSGTASPAASARDAYGSTPGIRTLTLNGTNYDWARIVLVDGGWPQTDENITVLTRWMRQENGADDWWNRNNPLNIGAGGFGTFPNLLTAAQKTADLLRSNGGMSEIVAGLAAGNDSARTESAIWNSNWAGGHYAYGAHWHYTPVAQIKAPVGAWG